MDIRGTLKKIVKKNVGPPSMIGVAHIAIAMRMMHSRTHISRYSIQKVMGLSEAASRTLLKKMYDADLARASKKGSVLTEKGKQLAKHLEENIVEIDFDPPYKLDDSFFAVLIKNARGKMSSWEIRDHVIRCRGTAILVFEKKGNTLVLADLGKEISSFPALSHMKDQDIIIVSFAPNPHIARLSAYCAAIELI